MKGRRGTALDVTSETCSRIKSKENLAKGGGGGNTRPINDSLKLPGSPVRVLPGSCARAGRSVPQPHPRAALQAMTHDGLSTCLEAGSLNLSQWLPAL